MTVGTHTACRNLGIPWPLRTLKIMHRRHGVGFYPSRCLKAFHMHSFRYPSPMSSHRCRVRGWLFLGLDRSNLPGPRSDLLSRQEKRIPLSILSLCSGKVLLGGELCPYTGWENMLVPLVPPPIHDLGQCGIVVEPFELLIRNCCPFVLVLDLVAAT